MANTTEMVRKAIHELGADATDKQIRAYLKTNAPEVPQSQLGLVLRRLRESGERSKAQ
jgi:hypothetical protein